MARVPNIDRPDFFAFGLTSRQCLQAVGIGLTLAALGAGGFLALRPLGLFALVPLAFVVLALGAAGLGAIVMVRDGVPLTQWLRLAWRWYRLPRYLVLAPGGLREVPSKLRHALEDWRLATLDLPWSGYTRTGDVQVGPKDFRRILSVSGLDLARRSEAEQAKLASSWRRLADTLDSSIQVLARVEPVDLTPRIGELEAQAWIDGRGMLARALVDLMRESEGAQRRRLYLVIRGEDARALDAMQDVVAQAVQPMRLHLERVTPTDDLLPVPSAGEDHGSHLELDGELSRSFLMTGWPRAIAPAWLQPLLTLRGTTDVSLHISPVAEQAAAPKIERLLDLYRSTESTGQADLGITASRRDAEAVGTALVQGEVKLFSVGLYVTARAPDAEALEDEVRQLASRCRSLGLTAKPATWRQRRGWVTNLPVGIDALGLTRTMPSDALADVFPFATGDFVGHPETGVLYGRALPTDAPVFVDRFRLHPPHEVILGQSDVGKSMLAKLTIGRQVLRGIRVRILDIEGEYERLTRTLAGDVVDARAVRATTAQLACYSLREVPEKFRPDAAARALETIWDGVRADPETPQVVVVDEGFLLLVRNEEAAHIVWSLAKRSRKSWCGLVTITQDLDDFLATDLGKAIIANSGIKVLLSQDASAIPALTKAFWLSEGEQEFLVAAPQGQGLVIAGHERAAVRFVATPFEYAYATTTPSEVVAAEVAKSA